MLERLFPRERDFFPTFDRISDCLSDATVELLKAIDGSSRPMDCLEQTKKLEKKATRIVRESIQDLHNTFVTPFDRSHIFKFMILHTEIISLIRLLTEKLNSYGIQKLPLESIEIVSHCGQCCGLIRKMVGQMKKIKRPADTLNVCVSIYEMLASNNLLAFAVSKELYASETDIKKLLKIKEINQDLISVTKKFEAISFLIEEIILEYA